MDENALFPSTEDKTDTIKESNDVKNLGNEEGNEIGIDVANSN